MLNFNPKYQKQRPVIDFLLYAANFVWNFFRTKWRTGLWKKKDIDDFVTTAIKPKLRSSMMGGWWRNIFPKLREVIYGWPLGCSIKDWAVHPCFSPVLNSIPNALIFCHSFFYLYQSRMKLRKWEIVFKKMLLRLSEIKRKQVVIRY